MFDFIQADNHDRTWEWIGGSPAGAVSATSYWQAWTKDMAYGCRFMGVSLWGAGAGGGNGFTRTAGNPGGGGGGGGSGGFVSAVFPLQSLPDTIYFYLPAGGTAGVVGGRAYMSSRFSSSSTDVFLVSGAADATAGGNGAVGAAGALGAASTVALITTMAMTRLAMSFTAFAGNAGTAGGAHTGAAGGNVTSVGVVSGGAGGGGIATTTPFKGGDISAIGLWPAVPGGATGASAPGADGFVFTGSGSDGSGLQVPESTSGGAGGTSANAVAGGNGGNGGGWASGGGGGGAGTTGGTGGTGAPARVMIYCW